jgi:hypothetical protein
LGRTHVAQSALRTHQFGANSSTLACATVVTVWLAARRADFLDVVPVARRRGGRKPHDCLFWEVGTLQESLRRAECPQSVCAVTRRRFPVGARPTRRFAPAGSNRSSHGGNEMAEAFD